MVAGELHFTAAARNAVWTFPREAPARFAGAPTIIEQTRSHDAPEFDRLPEGSDVSVELYGAPVSSH